MEKTQEELDQIKLEYESMIEKLKELSDEELEIVTGGSGPKNWEFFLGVDVNF